MQIVLSIVIPVYCVEKYIRKCLDSLVLENARLMDQLEVIVVNDGTPDRSAEISREYVERYPNSFRQIDKSNGGHGSAWNVGLKEARGKYIRFLDSDDWFSNLDRLMDDLKECDADIVFNPFNMVYSYENRIVRIDTPIRPGTTDLPEYWGGDDVNFWGATYKTSILQPLYPLFAEKVMYDDYILTWAPLIYGRTFFALDYVVYNYLLGRPGQTNDAKRDREAVSSYLKCLEQSELIRSKFVNSDIPPRHLEKIEYSITGNASYIFAYMLNLPYKEAKSKMEFLWDKYLATYDRKTPLQKRYEALPFPLFSFIELIRRKVLKR